MVRVAEIRAALEQGNFAQAEKLSRQVSDFYHRPAFPGGVSLFGSLVLKGDLTALAWGKKNAQTSAAQVLTMIILLCRVRPPRWQATAVFLRKRYSLTNHVPAPHILWMFALSQNYVGPVSYTHLRAHET